MTTIAYNKNMIAADTQVSAGNFVRHTSKILFVDSISAVLGFTGTESVMNPLFDWYIAGHDVSNMPKFLDKDYAGVLLVIREHEVVEIDSLCPHMVTVPYRNMLGRCDAAGSGSDLALGAMDAGCTPEEAVKIACKRDLYTGGRVDVIIPPWAKKGRG